MGIHHRVPAISTACFSSVALCLSTLAGTSCSFLEIAAKQDMLLLSADEMQLTVRSAYIGILCDNGFFERDGDQMWELSRIFFIVSLVLGSISTSLAWAVSTFLPPTILNWKILSTLSSLTAVLQVPVFLVFEAEPCSKFLGRQECVLAMASYFLMASTIFWVAVVFLTQCMDPPLWAIELSAWRVQKRGSSRPSGRQSDRDHSQRKNRPTTPREKTNKSSSSEDGGEEGRKRWFCLGRRNVQDPMDVRLVKTESVKDEDHFFDGHDTSIDSRLILRVQPDGKRPGDDIHSTPSFEDLDSVVEMAEEGRLPELKTRPSSPKKMGMKAVDDGKHRYAHASQTAQEKFTIIGIVPDEPQQEQQKQGKARGTSDERKQGGSSPRQTPVNPLETRRSNTNMAYKELDKSAPLISASPLAILKDLENIDREQSHMPQQQQQPRPLETQKDNTNSAPVESQVAKNAESEKGNNTNFKDGVRAFTKKVKRDARKKKRGSRRQARKGYALIDDDEDDSYDDEDDAAPYNPSPLMKVNITNMEDFEKLGRTDDAFTSNDKKLMDEWNALHAATRAGAQVALFEDANERLPNGSSNVAPFPLDWEKKKEHPLIDEHVKIPFDDDEYGALMDGDSCDHSDISFSDPEPAYYSSDETKSEVSLSSMERFEPEKFHDEDEGSIGSGASPASSGSRRSRRRKGGGRRNRRRKHRASASIASIRSTRSLMDFTIDEETVQDVLEEDEEADLGSGYQLQRTKSAPTPRSKGLSMLRPPRLSRSESTDGLSMDGSFDDQDRMPSVANEEAERTDRPSRRCASLPRTAKKIIHKRSSRSPTGSPRDSTRAKDAAWKEQREFDGGIHARGTVVSDDDSSSSSNQSFNTSASRRARRARILRLRGLPPKTEITSTPLSMACDDDSQSETNHYSPTSSGRNVDKTIPGDVDHSVDDVIYASSNTTTLLPSDQPQKIGNTAPPTEPSPDISAALMQMEPELDHPMVSTGSDDYIPESVHLQIIANRRPEGAEYGDDEASL